MNKYIYLFIYLNVLLFLGFGFIFFKNEESVDICIEKKFHKINDKIVECKRPFPKVIYSNTHSNMKDNKLDQIFSYNDGSHNNKLDINYNNFFDVHQNAYSKNNFSYSNQNNFDNGNFEMNNDICIQGNKKRISLEDYNQIIDKILVSSNNSYDTNNSSNNLDLPIKDLFSFKSSYKEQNNDFSNYDSSPFENFIFSSSNCNNNSNYHNLFSNNLNYNYNKYNKNKAVNNVNNNNLFQNLNNKKEFDYDSIE